MRLRSPHCSYERSTLSSFLERVLLSRSGSAAIKAVGLRSMIMGQQPLTGTEIALALSYQRRPVVRLWMSERTTRGNATQRFHACANQLLWARYGHSRSRRLRLVRRACAWPITAGIVAAICVACYGRAVKAQFGPGLLTQWAQAWAVAVRHRILPIHYYYFGFYKPERRKRAGEYISDELAEILFRVANQPISSIDRRDRDKRWFAEQCQRFGLAHVPIIATFEAGHATRPITDATLPRADLFVKPSDACSGFGAERWHYKDAYYEDDEGNFLTAAELVGHIQELSKERPHIVQLMIANHADIAPISNGALCTVRLLTGLRRGSTEPTVILATLRMGVGRSAVDSFGAGGIAAPIDTATGWLGMAVSNDPSKPFLDKHPDTGKAIAQRVFPMWPECVELSLRAHRCFAPIAFVGWDIAVTSDGPVLVERNSISHVKILQMSHGVPLLSTAFADVFLSHVDAGTEPLDPTHQAV